MDGLTLSTMEYQMSEELFLFGIALGIVAILASFITIGFKEKHGEK